MIEFTVRMTVAMLVLLAACTTKPERPEFRGLTSTVVDPADDVVDTTYFRSPRNSIPALDVRSVRIDSDGKILRVIFEHGAGIPRRGNVQVVDVPTAMRWGTTFFHGDQVTYRLAIEAVDDKFFASGTDAVTEKAIYERDSGKACPPDVVGPGLGSPGPPRPSGCLSFNEIIDKIYDAAHVGVSSPRVTGNKLVITVPLDRLPKLRVPFSWSAMVTANVSDPLQVQAQELSQFVDWVPAGRPPVSSRRAPAQRAAFAGSSCEGDWVSEARCSFRLRGATLLILASSHSASRA
jgi:hypothetical protein